MIADDHPTSVVPGTTRVERLVSHPLAAAGVLATVYIVVCSLYIVYSDRVAAVLATSPDMYERIQTYKGLAFVVLSGLMFFVFAARVLRLLEQRRRRMLQQAEALVQAESRAQSGILAASLAHDINNILTVITGRIELLMDDPRLPPAARDEVAQLMQTVDRLTRLVRFLAEMGKEQVSSRREDVDLVQLLDDVVELTRSHRGLRHRRLSVDMPPTIPCRVDPRIVSRAVFNLLVNAAEATASDGRIELRARVREAGDVVITVDDDGPGVPAEQRDDVFREFYTTKEQGSGLGLMSVKYCAHEHDGDWTLASSPLGGARFEIALPVRRQPAEATLV
jgi:two-component system sensor histidine kinase HydH